MSPLWKDDKAGVRVVRLTKTKEIETILRLFETVAREENWQPEGALRLHQNRSIYFALMVDGQLAGGLQLVLAEQGELGEQGNQGKALPCQTLWPEVLVVPPLNRRAHVSVLALHPAFRGRSSLFWVLVVEMWRFCVGEGIATLFIEVTPRVLPLYRRLGWPLIVRGDAKVHWGEECVLCTLGIPDVAQALLQRAEHSAYYRQIVSQAFRVTRPAATVATVAKRAESLPVPALPIVATSTAVSAAAVV